MTKTGLLVIDMQNHFLPMVTHSLPCVQRLISHFRSCSLPVIFTQHGHSDDELTGPPYTNQLVAKWGPEGSIRIGTKNWEFMSGIQSVVGSSPVVGKNTYDGFLGTGLEEMLRGYGVERVAICGVMTDCCCDTTGRGAFNRGFETWMVEDACASANDEQHNRGIAVFEFAYGSIVSTEDVVRRV